MTIAAHSRTAAQSVQAAFWQVALTSTPAALAHLVLYPYTSAELFYRYCRLNGTLARTDVEQYLTSVKQPTLVVTSEDDETAHPQGSRQLAQGLPNACLRVEASRRPRLAVPRRQHHPDAGGRRLHRASDHAGAGGRA